MPGASAGVVGMAEVNAAPGSGQPKGFGDPSSPAFWSTVWFALALIWLFYVFGRGR